MKKLLLLILIILALHLKAAENKADHVVKPAAENEDLPYNAHEFDWEAVSDSGAKYSGHAVDYSVGAAFADAKRELDRMAKKGIVDDGTEFSITIEWKGKKFKRSHTAVAKYPKELPRGPDKAAEAPRGPIKR